MDGRVTGGGEDARKRRLAAALRENLRRRKAQSRGRAAGDGGDVDPGSIDPASARISRPPTPAAGVLAAAVGEDLVVQSPTSQSPTSQFPTSRAPTSEAPTSQAPTSQAPLAHGLATDDRMSDDVTSDDPAVDEMDPDITWRVRLVAAELEAERIAALIERAVEADGWPVTRYELPPAVVTGSTTGPAIVAPATTAPATIAPTTAAPAIAGAAAGGSESGAAKTNGAVARSRPLAERSVAVEAGAGAPAFAARLLRDEEWPWAVEVLVFGGTAAEARARILDAVGGDGFGSLITVEPLEAEDWVAKSLEGLPPVREGRFVVRGRHARGGEPAGTVAIDIDAGLAFGTGHHATTVGCLAAMERSLARRRPRRPLDLGTGTGVLAIAIARLAKVSVVASDIDPVAVRVAAGNARANGVGPWVRPFVATGMADRRLAVGRFDLVVANILARPLERLAPAIGRALSPRAVVILSGLRVPDGRRVEAAYRRQGLVLTRRDARDGWLTLTFERG